MLLSVINPYQTSMSFPSQSSPQKRPRLSLQIKTPTTAVTFGKSSTALKSDVDPTSPTAFNTLSNAYAIAIENSSPRTARPIVDFKSAKPTSLRVETKISHDGGYVHPSRRTQTPGPFTVTYPDTPSSALPGQALVSGSSKSSSTSFTFTPPQSAGTSDTAVPRIFTFDANIPSKDSVTTPRTPRTPRQRRSMMGNPYQVAPYTHPRALHSILRNSPLPPPSTITPATPTRVSIRLANRAAKKVGYNDPLTQTITTNKYIKSHIDLLTEDSPYPVTPSEIETESLDLALAHTASETRDGGQTPGPFEEMRRRMAESELETAGPKKRKRKEKKRLWEWTINSTEAEGEESKELKNETPLTAVRTDLLLPIIIPPSPAVDRAASVSEDSEMSEPEERFVPSFDQSPDSEMSDLEQRPGTSQSL